LTNIARKTGLINDGGKTSMSRKYLGPILASLLLLGLSAAPALAAKTDVVILINGNAVTGEVKSLEFGLLEYGTDSMGTVDIDWEDIVSVTTKQKLQVELTYGTRYYGELMATGEPHSVRIVTLSDEYVLKANQVVRMTPIETSEKFYKRLDGSFSFGVQTQKSSGVTTSNLAADVSYRARTYLLGLRINSAITSQDDPALPTTARQSASTNYQRFRKNRWFTEWFTGWEMNDEQGIESRVSFGGALGRYFVQTNKTQFSLTAGLQASQTEFFSLDDPDATDAEGRFEIRFLRRKLIPEADLRFTATIFPLLEDLTQFRAESDMSLRREIVKDLFLDLSIGYSYLSDPPEGGQNTDYTATTSIGYSF